VCLDNAATKSVGLLSWHVSVVAITAAAINSCMPYILDGTETLPCPGVSLCGHCALEAGHRWQITLLFCVTTSAKLPQTGPSTRDHAG
jgi:hypothetical protein